MTAPTKREPIGFDPGGLRQIKPKELLIRFAFGAVVSAAAASVGKYVGPVAGGLFLAFPAILPAALTLIAEKESERAAVNDDRGAVCGVLGLGAFAFVIWRLGDQPAIALAAGGAAWIVVSLASYLIWRAVRTAVGIEEKLPDTEAGTPSTTSAKAARRSHDRRHRPSLADQRDS